MCLQGKRFSFLNEIKKSLTLKLKEILAILFFAEFKKIDLEH